MFHLTSTSTGKRNKLSSALKLFHKCICNDVLIPQCIQFPFCVLFLSRGMKFENVQILTDAISDIITDMKWAW